MWIFTALRTRLGKWAAAIGIVLTAVAGAFLRGRQAARKEKELDDMRNAYERETTRHEVERDIDRRGDAHDRLRTDWRRG